MTVAPPGMTEPASVAAVAVTEPAGAVVTVGGPGAVVNDSGDANRVPAVV